MILPDFRKSDDPPKAIHRPIWADLGSRINAPLAWPSEALSNREFEPGYPHEARPDWFSDDFLEDELTGSDEPKQRR